MIQPPIGEELAKPESIQGNANTFVQVLVPEDTVLAQRGRDYRIYREVLRDDQCKSAFQQRRDAVLACSWEVEPASESAQDKAAADFITEQLATAEFDRITDKMLYATWYGHAVGECMWGLDGGKIILTDVRVRDRGRFAFDSNRGLHLLRKGRYELMPERKFWTISTGADHDDEPYGLGLAHYCYWPVFFKRNDIKFWLVFLEKWAAPTIKGKAPMGVLEDAGKRDLILDQLRAFASDTAILVPDGIEVELMEAARSGTASYEAMAAAMDASLAKIILSQTMTTDNGSSRSQATVHEGVRDLVVKSDADLICSSFNKQVITWLTEWNFPNAKPPRVWRNLEPADDLNKRAERDAKVYTLGYEPTEEYVQEHYGDGWQKRAVQAGVTPQDLASQAAAQFAELGVIAAAKGSRRADQQELVDAAQRFANKYPEILGQRVQQLLDHAEASSDYETFRKHLLEMMSEGAPRQSADAVVRTGILGRLLGRFRAQR
jgi:phage gp29-like protein